MAKPASFYRVHLSGLYEGDATDAVEYRSEPTPSGCLFAIRRSETEPGRWIIGTRANGAFVELRKARYMTLRDAKDAVRTMAKHPQRVAIAHAYIELRNAEEAASSKLEADKLAARQAALFTCWHYADTTLSRSDIDGLPIMLAAPSSTVELVSRYANAEDVTEEEAAAVVAWSREWLADVDDTDAEGLLPISPSLMSPAEVLRRCDRHIEGGIAFVLADVRHCATCEPISRHCECCGAPLSIGSDSSSCGCADKPAYRIERQHSRSEDGYLWYVVDAEGNRVSGDGWIEEKGARFELADIQRQALLTPHERAAVDVLRSMTPAPGDYGIAVLVADAVEEYRYLEPANRDEPVSDDAMRKLVDDAMADYAGAAGCIVTPDACCFAIEPPEPPYTTRGRLADPKPRAKLTVAEIHTQEAAEALVKLYGQFNAGYLAQVFSAGWLTDAERKAFAPLVEALEARALGEADDETMPCGCASGSCYCDGEPSM